MSSSAFLAHGVTLALAWFIVVNIVCGALVVVLSRALARHPVGSPAFWLAVRLFPAAAALAFVGLLFVPSYWKYEPRELVEGFDISLTILAAIAGATIAGGLARGARALRSAMRRTREWMRHARPIALPSSPLPTFVIDAGQPMLALVGLFRPRLLVTQGLVDALTAPELAASVAHELGHRHAFDNLKRLIIRSTPDLLANSAAVRTIERRWVSAAERAADRAAAGHDANDRCALASALVKVARLTATTVIPAAEPTSALLSDADVTSRVQLLLDETAPHITRRARLMWWSAAVAIALTLVVSYGPLVLAVHDATEFFVNSLP